MQNDEKLFNSKISRFKVLRRWKSILFENLFKQFSA